MQSAIRHLKKADPVMAQLIERVGAYRPKYAPPTFENVARTIAYQQLNGKAAATIFGRLVEACRNGDPQCALTAEAILSLKDEQMRAVGFSRQKMSYLRDLATRTVAREIEFERMLEMSDEDVIEHLTRVKGIGVWSAQMFLMFALRRPDVMPTLDFGINLAIKKLYRKRVLKPKHILKVAEPWRPWRSVACWYLWRSLDATTLETP